MSEYTENELKNTFNKAKVTLMASKNSTFLATILFRLNQKFTKDVPTAGVDFKNLYINPDWWMGLTPDQRVGLLAHEPWHPALDHLNRGNNFDGRIYNIAGDYVINNMLDRAGYVLPPHGYMNHDYDNMTTEQVYHAIYEEFKNKDQGYDCDINYTPDNLSDDEKEQIKQHIDNMLIQAKIQAEQAGDKLEGNIPSDILRRLDELLNPKLPWNVILQDFVNACAKQDYSFKRPNRRFTPDFYLPTLDGRTIEHVCVAIDTSGSVRDDEFTAFLTEIQNIKDFSKPKRLTIMDFDTRVKAIHELDEYDRLENIEFKGRGGTDMHDVFEKATKMNPTLFIMFSDMYCEKITKQPPFPVLWVAVNNPNFEPEFGRKIDLAL